MAGRIAGRTRGRALRGAPVFGRNVGHRGGPGHRPLCRPGEHAVRHGRIRGERPGWIDRRPAILDAGRQGPHGRTEPTAVRLDCRRGCSGRYRRIRNGRSAAARAVGQGAPARLGGIFFDGLHGSAASRRRRAALRTRGGADPDRYVACASRSAAIVPHRAERRAFHGNAPRTRLLLQVDRGSVDAKREHRAIHCPLLSRAQRSLADRAGTPGQRRRAASRRHGSRNRDAGALAARRRRSGFVRGRVERRARDEGDRRRPTILDAPHLGRAHLPAAAGADTPTLQAVDRRRTGACVADPHGGRAPGAERDLGDGAVAASVGRRRTSRYVARGGRDDAQALSGSAPEGCHGRLSAGARQPGAIGPRERANPRPAPRERGPPRGGRRDESPVASRPRRLRAGVDPAALRRAGAHRGPRSLRGIHAHRLDGPGAPIARRSS